MKQRKNNHPRVGVAAIVMKGNEILLGKRRGTHGAGTWSFPGGKLNMWEEPKVCAKRETKEESDLDIEIIDDYPAAITNDMFFQDEKHYLTLYYRAKYLSGESKVLEPEKCEEWKWFKWGYFPNNLFLPIKNLIKTEYNPLKQNGNI